MSDSLVNLLTFDQLLDVPEPEWLITDFMHCGEVGVIYGPPNCGKTFVALDWALSVAAGVPFLGEYKVRQGPTLYCAGEGAPSLQKRVAGWMVNKNVTDIPAYFQCRPLPIIEDGTVDEVREALSKLRIDMDTEPGIQPTLIVVDTLSQFMMGGDENGTDMALFVANLRHLSQEENCSVLIVHHMNASGLRERGHTALRGNVDVMFRATSKEVQGQLAGIELLNDKQRDNPRARPCQMAVTTCQESLVLSLQKTDKVPDYVMTLSTESLAKLLAVTVTIEDVEKELIEVAQWHTSSNLNLRTFHRLRDKLLALKLIKGAGHGKYKLTPLGRETAVWYSRHSDRVS